MSQRRPLQLGRPSGEDFQGSLWAVRLLTFLCAVGIMAGKVCLRGHNAVAKAGCGGEAVLQSGVPELVDRSYGAEDIAVMGILKKLHQAHRGVPFNGYLN